MTKCQGNITLMNTRKQSNTTRNTDQVINKIHKEKTRCPNVKEINTPNDRLDILINIVTGQKGVFYFIKIMSLSTVIPMHKKVASPTQKTVSVRQRTQSHSFARCDRGT